MRRYIYTQQGNRLDSLFFGGKGGTNDAARNPPQGKSFFPPIAVASTATGLPRARSFARCSVRPISRRSDVAGTCKLVKDHLGSGYRFL